ncbi:RNA polymerase sigma factor [Novipirellula sp.]|uniref:RNA polymerase sigma factor n=1 Tax=Novipirellula sp. TaxID=2795430 RepID=UPI00356825C8
MPLISFAPVRARYVGLSKETLDLLEQHWSVQQAGHREDASNRETLLSALSECLETLTPRSQQVIKLRYFENRSGSEIASYLGRLAAHTKLLVRAHDGIQRSIWFASC